MDLEEWNTALDRWFLMEGPNRPVYVAATDAELRRMNDRLGLGLDDPVEDLRRTVSLHSYSSLSHLERIWERAGRRDHPPWLAYLAATVVIVDRETEQASLAFYRPLSRFLDVRPDLNQDSYGDVFYRWWRQLADWLDSAQAGARGFPTWRAIPEAGPRSVIGHPYTQVLLRREDRLDVDQFLAEFSSDYGEPPELDDRKAAAEHLVSALRTWARAGRTLRPRLRSILEGSREAERESLGFILLDRLFDHREETDERSVRQLAVVPMFDEFDRVLSIAVVAPAWVSPTRPLELPDCSSIVEPGAPMALQIEPSSAVLEEGFAKELGEDTRMVLRGRSVHALASREWDFWCGVSSVELDEDVFLLARNGEGAVAGRPAFRFPVKNLPAGWGLFGPAPLDGRNSVATVRDRPLVPRRRGGLALDAVSYLVGGEPIIDLAGVSGPVVINGDKVGTDRDQIDLASMNLAEGSHSVTVGPYTLRFSTVVVDQPPTLRPTPRSKPRMSDAELGRFIHLIPRVTTFVLFGIPGESAVIEATRTSWADHYGLVHAATDPIARSTYPRQDRVVSQLCWVAWIEAGAWAIAELPGGDLDRKPLLEAEDWHLATSAIGPNPRIAPLTAGGNAADALERWRQYCKADVGR